MFVRSFQRWLAAGTGVALAVAIAACGGGGSSGGIGGTGIEPSVAYGTITNFGSVWVNGVEYSTTNTTFKTDDHPSGGGSQSELRVGMVVRVDGAVSARRADTITEDESLKGLVEQVIGTDQIVVLGQTVRIDPATAFEGGVRPGLTDRVEVHGQIAGDGVIAAGFIEKKTTAPTPPYALKGIVRSQDTAAQTLQIGTLVVQYAGATLRHELRRRVPGVRHAGGHEARTGGGVGLGHLAGRDRGRGGHDQRRRLHDRQPACRDDGQHALRRRRGERHCRGHRG